MKLSRETVAELQRLARDKGREAGGALEVRDGQLALPSGYRRGAKRKIKLKTTRYMFHTHPNVCTKAVKGCALGPPSSTDVASFFKTATEGCLAHLVISPQDGVYVMKLAPGFPVPLRPFVARSLTDRAALEAAKRTGSLPRAVMGVLKVVFRRLEEAFHRQGKARYEDFRRSYLQRLNGFRLGGQRVLEVKLFPTLADVVV